MLGHLRGLCVLDYNAYFICAFINWIAFIYLYTYIKRISFYFFVIEVKVYIKHNLHRYGKGKRNVIEALLYFIYTPHYRIPNVKIIKIQFILCETL